MWSCFIALVKECLAQKKILFNEMLDILYSAVSLQNHDARKDTMLSAKSRMVNFPLRLTTALSNAPKVYHANLSGS